MLTFVTWLWGTKYGVTDVERLFRAVDANTSKPHRCVAICDGEEPDDWHWEWLQLVDTRLTSIPGCFVRLRMWDPAFQDILAADEIACLDLDVVVTDSLDPLFGPQNGDFAILKGANSANPCPYNGSIMALRAGTNAHVWSEFSIEAARAIPFHEFPDDQGWLWQKVPDARGWVAGTDGVYAFKKPGWPKGDALPADARIVAFPGWRHPSKFLNIEWIRERWT